MSTVAGQEYILWARRRTPSWLNLSLAARGAAEGLAVAVDDRGEIPLGTHGLPGLARLLGVPWEECKESIFELLTNNRFRHDVERNVVADQQHPERQGEAARRIADRVLAAERVAAVEREKAALVAERAALAAERAAIDAERARADAEARAALLMAAPPKKTPSTERVQAHRARRMRSEQLELVASVAPPPLPSEPERTTGPNESGVMRCVRFAPEDPVPETHETHETLAGVSCVSSHDSNQKNAVTNDTYLAHEKCFIKVEANSPSLSDLKIFKKEREGRAPPCNIVQRDAPIPDHCRASFVEACGKAGVELDVEHVWAKFTLHGHDKRWDHYQLVLRWPGWVRREINWTKPPPGIAKTRARPDDDRARATEYRHDPKRWQQEASTDAQMIAATATVAAALERGDLRELRAMARAEPRSASA